MVGYRKYGSIRIGQNIRMLSSFVTKKGSGAIDLHKDYDDWLFSLTCIIVFFFPCALYYNMEGSRTSVSHTKQHSKTAVVII